MPFLFDGAGDLKALFVLDIGVCCYKGTPVVAVSLANSSFMVESPVYTISVGCIFKNIDW